MEMKIIVINSEKEKQEYEKRSGRKIYTDFTHFAFEVVSGDIIIAVDEIDNLLVHSNLLKEISVYDLKQDNNKYYFFWNGVFSNWYTCLIKYKGHIFKNTEQAFMYEKARFFHDEHSVNLILKEINPRKVKALGRKVKNFNAKAWNSVAYKFMYDINYEKFTQHESFKKVLLATENQLIVEASPYDKIWGIGLTEEDAKKIPESEWLGTNLLGKCLTKLREELKNNK
jgi:ribA/ribD-fused uncharacterized protein